MPELQDPENDAAPNLALPWVVRLRYAMVLGGAATLGGVACFLGFYSALRWTFAPLVCVLGSNLWLHRVAARSIRAPQTILGYIFLLDTVCLTAVLGLTGGPMNPFSLLYLVQITLAAVVLKKQWVCGLGVLASLCFGLLFVLHVSLKGSHVHSGEPGLSSHLAGMWIAFVIAAALISFFTSRVSYALRIREQEVLRLQEHVARQEKLTSLVTLAAGAAHELGTPLGTIAVVARELERYALTLRHGNAVCEDAKLIRSEVERCQHILQRMSADGAEPIGESPRTIEMAELLRRTVLEIPETKRPHVTLEATNGPANLFLPVRATVQSLAALLSNALDAGSSDIQVDLKARQIGEEVIFSVCDNGTGMTEDVQRRIAEPFFTTKEPGRGMGLGTFLVRTFAERLGGGLSYTSAPGRGTTATLRLPVEFLKQKEGSRGRV
ncbi:MAG TPA: ATP-binding protein [Silvibacterium sp.]|nr:ATP-binding protein [Silvibacterium sp.]